LVALLRTFRPFEDVMPAEQAARFRDAKAAARHLQEQKKADAYWNGEEDDDG
jgi:diadenosine tetraphosphate (Ap4A) HIT family hydrolase